PPTEISTLSLHDALPICEFTGQHNLRAKKDLASPFSAASRLDIAGLGARRRPPSWSSHVVNLPNMASILPKEGTGFGYQLVKPTRRTQTQAANGAGQCGTMR